MKPVVCLLILVVIIAGCSQKRKPSPVLVASAFKTFKLDTNPVTKNISDFAESISYINLESKEECMIGTVDKIDFFDGKFFLLDKKISKSLTVFDKSGKYIYQKHMEGFGPVKISEVSDFTIDRKNKILYLYDAEQSKVLSFEINNGNPIKTIQLPGFFSKLVIAPGGNLLLMRDGLLKYADEFDENRICEISPDGKLINSWIEHPLHPFVNAGDIYNGRSEAIDSCFIARMLCDTIFCWTNNELKAVSKIESPKNSVNLLATKDMEEFKSQIHNPTACYISGNLFDNKKTFSCFYKWKDLVCLFWHDKSKNDEYLIRNFNNDIDNTMLPLMGYMDDSCFLSVINPYLLNQQYKYVSSQPDFQSKYKELVRLTSSLKESSNPVIAIVKLK